MIIRADARHLPLADRTVQCCVTSPPYWGLRDYGVAGQLGLESTPDAYVAQMVAVFREVRRVLKDDGVCWVNLGDSYAGGGRGSGGDGPNSPKQRTNLGAYFAGNTAFSHGVKAKDLVGIPWRVAFALQADCWYLRQDIIWHKPNPMPESVRDRCTKAHEYLFLLAKQERYYWDAEAMKEAGTGRSSGMVGPDKTGAGKGFEIRGGFAKVGDVEWHQRNRRSVWTITTQPTPDAHFATMPEALVEPCILASTKPGDVVLDPFLGSGTVGRVATSLGRQFVGTELNPDYCRLAQRRCQVTRGLPLEFTA